MAAERFFYCLAETLREEINWGKRQPVGGPYIRNKAVDNDPDDTGGITFMGILQREFNAWNDAHHLERRGVGTITDDEVHDIYFANYWQAVSASKLPVGVDLAVFDMGVVCGVGTAARRLQAALGVKQDGHIGVMTLKAAGEADPVDLIERFTLQRLDYHKRCKTYWKHGKGWDGRAKRLEAIATEWSGHDPSAFTLARAGNPIPVMPPQPPEADEVGTWETETTEEAPPKPREREAASAMSSKTVLGAITAFCTTVVAMIKAVGDMLKHIASIAPKGPTGKAELGAAVVAGGLATDPFFWCFVATLGLLVYIARERIAKFIPRLG